MAFHTKGKQLITKITHDSVVTWKKKSFSLMLSEIVLYEKQFSCVYTRTDIKTKTGLQKGTNTEVG